MKLLLQFGYGMMDHSRELLKAWGGGGVVLSPRDLTNDQLIRMGQDINKIGGDVYVDPQCFVHNADWHRLKAHQYFQRFQSHATNAFFGGPATRELLSDIFELGKSVGVKKHILPGMLADSISEDWFALQSNIVKEAAEITDRPLLATVALSDKVLKSEEQVEAIIERAEQWNTSGIYLVAETPSSYLVDDPAWLANLLILASGLKLVGKEVIVGYCNHQMLCLASANVDYICSGTWLNVRAFPTDKFYTPPEDEISRRAIWYYCPQALSEYKLAILDIAHRTGVLQAMKSDPGLKSTYGEPIFAGPLPSSLDWGEQNAFRHYLSCLNGQILQSRKADFDSTVDHYMKLLDASEKTVTSLRKNAVLGGDRDFHELFDVNRSAMIVFSNARKHRLKRSW